MEEQIKESLKKVVDPEIGINIVDLGLVYKVKTSGNNIHIDLTLTTPGCPMSNSITQAVRQVLETDFLEFEAEVELVWLPLWTPEMITDEGRTMMGM